MPLGCTRKCAESMLQQHHSCLRHGADHLTSSPVDCRTYKLALCVAAARKIFARHTLTLQPNVKQRRMFSRLTSRFLLNVHSNRTTINPFKNTQHHTSTAPVHLERVSSSLESLASAGLRMSTSSRKRRTSSSNDSKADAYTASKPAARRNVTRGKTPVLPHACIVRALCGIQGC